MPEFRVLENFPEFCYKECVRCHIYVDQVVEDFLEAWHCFCEIYSWDFLFSAARVDWGNQPQCQAQTLSYPG